MRTLDFWYEFASTYSYPAAMRIEDVARSHAISVRWRPFLLGPIFAQQGWTTSPFNIFPAKGRNMVRDLERICQSAGLPFRMPDPFPQNSLLAARAALVLDEAQRRVFSRAVYSREFGDGQAIDSHAAVADILAECGFDAADIIARATSDAGKAALRQQSVEAQAHGIFGAPSFVTVDGELFWGNDRLETAVEWAVTAPDVREARGA